jgi:dethiobiotin synthetase
VGGCVVAGIGTEVGKTVVSAVLVQRLGADYWKPIQAGGLDDSDGQAVARLAPNAGTLHPEAYRLTQPMSPDAAADIDGETIRAEGLKLPHSNRFLVVELAGGLRVPLSDTLTNLDLLRDWRLPVVLVANYYLGSINHTLLSIDALRFADIDIAGLVFNGHANEASRASILSHGRLPVLLDMPWADDLTAGFVEECAAKLDWPG